MQWIKVADRLPEKEKEVLICNDEGEVMFGRCVKCARGWDFFTTNFQEFLLPGLVTHWMDLPKPPEKSLGDYPGEEHICVDLNPSVEIVPHTKCDDQCNVIIGGVGGGSFT